MSQQDQERAAKIISLLVPHLSWRFIVALVGVPTALIASITLMGYLLSTATFLQGVNFAAKKVPVLDTALRRVDGQLQGLTASYSELKDTLRHDGYVFTRQP